MKWIDDPSGRFPARPWFEAGELDLFGARLADEAARRRRARFRPPLGSDALLVLLEAYVDDLDLYADLEPLFGPGVEGVTEFRPGRRPVVLIERRLAADPRRHHRLRFTLAHELGHVVLHRDLWERRFAQPELFTTAPPRPEAAHSRLPEGGGGQPAVAAAGGGREPPSGAVRAGPEAPPPTPGTIRPAAGALWSTAGDPLAGAAGRRADWLEWQAAYVAAALLVPAPALAAQASALTRAPGGRGAATRPFAGTPEGDAVVEAVARSFQVSTEAAAVRLVQTKWLREPADARQRSFWTP